MGGSSTFRVVVRGGPQGGKAYPLPAEGVVRVGSSRPSQIVLNAPGLLGVHFFLKCSGGRVAVFVKDEDAKVLVNGAEVRKKLLEAGDSIQAGDAQLSLEALEKDPLLGQTVGGYRIDALIGRGAMGTVYKATQLSLDRSVALKILSPELTRDAAFVDRFLEEAKAAAKLNHPNVVQVYDAAAAPSPILPDSSSRREGEPPPDIAREEQLFYFSMEYLPGGTLQKLLDKEGKVSVEKALAMGCDTARALVWAEEHDIVHRDIKPSNLLFAADGVVKVADLGIAASIDRMMEGAEGMQGAGSPRYMAPEQGLRKGVDHRADIYALGSTLFRAIAGRHVFEGKTSAEVIKAKTTQDAPRLDAVLPDVPAEVADLVARMLAREVSGRPKTCAETLAALESCLAEAREAAGEGESADAGAGSTAARAAGRIRSRRPGRKSPGAEWREFIATTAGKISLSVSGMLVLLALAWPVAPAPPEPAPSGPEPVAAVPSKANAPGPATPPSVETAGGDSADPGAAQPREKASPAADPLAGGLDKAILRELGTIKIEYQTGLRDAKSALAAIEDFKRKHPESGYADQADRVLNQIRGALIEGGKSALTRFVSGDLKNFLEQGEYREAVSRLVKLGQAHPLNVKEVNEEIQKVEDAAREALKKAEGEADRAAAHGDFAAAVEALKKVEDTLPVSIQPVAAEKIASFTKDGKEYAQLAGPFQAQGEGVAEAIASLDFDGAASRAAALPKPKNALLAKRREAIAGEVGRCRAAWEALAAGAKRAGKSADPGTLLASPPKDLLVLLGGSPPANQVEGLGLLLLHARGPEPARDLLLDARLGPEKQAAYKGRLAEEEDAYLARYARQVLARLDPSKAAGGSPQTAWDAVAAEVQGRIASSRSLRGYERARADLAKAFLRARMEALRASVPGSLFKGKVKSYKPDGAIELVYEFTSEDELKDFVPVRSASSRLELEGKMAKMRGEFRLGRGDVFRNRLGVTGKLPANGGFSAQSPNINLALWTRDDDRVSPAKAIDERPPAAGVPDDYFAFGYGYKVRLPPGGSSEALVLKGSGASIAMPANVLLGGVRGAPLHSAAEGDCFWGKATGKVAGAQTFRVAMSSGALTWTLNSRPVLTPRELKDLEILKRTKPYTGSVTFFTNGEVLFFDAILVEGDVNPAWVEEQLLALAEADLKKTEPDYPFGK